MKNYELNTFATPNSSLDFENSLNDQQLKAVREAEGPCLVLAGAGSGKTRILIYRLAYLLEKGVHPQNILLVTFTNKAAYEMIHRSENLLKANLAKLWAGTFHHIGNAILRREADILGYSPNFTIADTSDAQDLIDDCFHDLGLLKRDKLFPKKNIISAIKSMSVNCQISIDETINKFYPHTEEYREYIKKVIAHYKKKKKDANVMDFDDLLLNWLNLLQNEDIRDKYSRLFRYILVDEYQDTNKLQFEILQRLASCHENILAVGDDAQSIYSFRGADINNLLSFPKVFSKAKIFKMEINYRSTPQVVGLANEVIRNNFNQFPKQLKAVKQDRDMPIVVKARDVYQQAKFVTQRMIELNREGIPLTEMAVLFRSRFQALELEVELLKCNIPYVIRGGVRFFEQAHIKDVLSYLKILINPLDELSFKRSLSLHKGIGRGYGHKIWEDIVKKKIPMPEILNKLPSKPKEGFKTFASILKSIKNNPQPQQMIKEILKFYKDHCYISFDNPEERILDLEELAKMASKQPDLKKFLLDLDSFESFKGETTVSANNKEDVSVLSTIHQAKGLEWETVFLIGFTDYEFPHPKSLNSKESLEEERRLFYVAATRTKSLLHIIHPEQKYTFKNGLVSTRPSMFLCELSKDLYEEYNLVDNY